jgi:hypothetical protein
MSRRILPLALAALAVLSFAVPAHAQFTGFERGGFGVAPIGGTSLGRGMSWFDPSRLSVSTSVTVGSGYGGTQSLQVMSFNYRFGAPLAMQVSVGNTFGQAGGTSPFLESFSLRYQPWGSTVFNFEFHDVRSPLQLTRGAHDPFARDAWWGY